jgi:cysteinyl-tRNA synthetase
MHNNMMTLDGQKMAKSKGNFISLEQMFSGDHALLEKAYSPMTVRFLILQAHYGSTIDFSNAALRSAEVACAKLKKGLKLIKGLEINSKAQVSEKISALLLSACESCYQKMNDDFNTPETIASLFEILGLVQKLIHAGEAISLETLNTVRSTYRGFLVDVLGIKDETRSKDLLLPEVMDILMDIRQQARMDKNFAVSDQIRDRLSAVGIQVKDNKENATYEFD